MSANIQAVCASFKQQILQAAYTFATGIQVFKAALFYQNNSMGYGTTAYSSSGEVSGTGYTAGGQTVTNANSPTVSGAVAIWTPSANLTWTGLTISSAFDTWLLYDVTVSNEAVAVFTFPAQTVASGTFTITMPTNAAGTALLQVS